MSSLVTDIEAQIAGAKTGITRQSVGIIREIGDGVARVEGLADVPATELGRVLATNNVLNTIGMLLASVIYWALADRLGLTIVPRAVGGLQGGSMRAGRSRRPSAPDATSALLTVVRACDWVLESRIGLTAAR